TKPLDHGHASVLAKDCSSCHTSPTASLRAINFKDGAYHSKITAAPNSCKECHSAKILDQPIWKTKDHSTIGASDCLACHSATGLNGTIAAPNWTGAVGGAPSTYTIASHVVTNSFAGFTAPHTSTNTNCTACHGTSTNYKTITGFDHLMLPAGSNTCVSCHLGSAASVAAYIGSGSLIRIKGTDSRHHSLTNFSKGVSCVGCHTATKGANTFNSTSSGVVFPSGARQASCHNGGQRTMTVPTTPNGAGVW
ncbi:MAG: hypothetical protein ABL927_11460, partial [Bdellovibrionales bacterium]